MSSPSIVAMLLITQRNCLVKPTRGIDCGYEAFLRLLIRFFCYLFQKWKKGLIPIPKLLEDINSYLLFNTRRCSRDNVEDVMSRFTFLPLTLCPPVTRTACWHRVAFVSKFYCRTRLAEIVSSFTFHLVFCRIPSTNPSI